jgi:hypothetical protein
MDPHQAHLARVEHHLELALEELRRHRNPPSPPTLPHLAKRRRRTLGARLRKKNLTDTKRLDLLAEAIDQGVVTRGFNASTLAWRDRATAALDPLDVRHSFEALPWLGDTPLLRNIWLTHRLSRLGRHGGPAADEHIRALWADAKLRVGRPTWPDSTESVQTRVSYPWGALGATDARAHFPSGELAVDGSQLWFGTHRPCQVDGHLYSPERQLVFKPGDNAMWSRLWAQATTKWGAEIVSRAHRWAKVFAPDLLGFVVLELALT